MARKPKLTVVGEEGTSPGQGHNSALSDDQRQALTRRYAQQFAEAEAKKKEADASLRNLGKKIKADLGDTGMADIKLLRELQSDDGEKKFRERMEAAARVARWSGLPIGAQGNLFDQDRRPIEEKALEEGKSAGMEGKDAKPPYAPGHAGYEPWMTGWHAGQAILAKGFKPTADAPLLREESEEKNEDGADDFDSAANEG